MALITALQTVELAQALGAARRATSAVTSQSQAVTQLASDAASALLRLWLAVRWYAAGTALVFLSPTVIAATHESWRRAHPPPPPPAAWWQRKGDAKAKAKAGKGKEAAKVKAPAAQKQKGTTRR
jgi:hypothetical protein